MQKLRNFDYSVLDYKKIDIQIDSLYELIDMQNVEKIMTELARNK